MRTGHYFSVDDNPNGLVAISQIAVSMILVLAAYVVVAIASGWSYVQAELFGRDHERS